MDIVSKITQSGENAASSGSGSSKATSAASQDKKADQNSSTANTDTSKGTSSTAKIESNTSSYVKPVITIPREKYSKSLKILAIGNSFSNDSMQYLFDICKSGGVQTVVLGNLYIAGCSLNTHSKNILSASPNYTYYKNTDGNWNTTENESVQNAIKEENWDIITVQQVSGYTGDAYSHKPLAGILEFLDKNKPNSETRIMWNMTWAYQSTSKHNDFAKYNNDQMTMYKAITNTVQSQVVTKDSICGIIPVGTAIQNLRSSYIGDVLTRDGQHLSYDYGRYTAALTWFHYITGISPDAVAWVPPDYSGISNDLAAIRESVVNAFQTPFDVTKSKYTQKP